tara:strand:- start:214 stop:1872 length:1659 start_codon:yes stop_codon:yes gene_type:complete
MKQLKIIVTDYSITNSSGIININFNQSINIPPYSSLALDKISMEILPNPSGLITLQADQEVSIITQVFGTKITQARSFVLRGGQYSYNTGNTGTANTSGYPDILQTLNSLCNGILIGTPKLPNTPEVDYGLGFRWSGALDTSVYKVSLDVFQVDFKSGAGGEPRAPLLQNADLTFLNMSSPAGPDNGYVSNQKGNYYVYTNKTLIQGCMQSNIDLRAKDYSDAGATFSYGLALPPQAGSTPIILYGIKAIDNKFYILNNGVQGDEIASAFFLAGPTTVVNVYLYTDDTTGHLRLAVAKSTNNVSYTTNINTYTGFSFNTAYCLAVTGNSTKDVANVSNVFQNWRAFFQPNLSTDNNGTFYNTPISKSYVSTPNLGADTPNRQIQVNFSKAPLLINNLGFGLNILQGNVSSINTLVFNAINGIDFQNWYDLALDVLNLSLENYVGSSGASSISSGTNGKRNTLSYFVVQRLTESESIFFAESKQLVFLSLENRETVSVSTLQFRIYNCATNVPVNFATASFNIYVGDKSDGGDHSRPFEGNRYLGPAHNVSQF